MEFGNAANWATKQDLRDLEQKFDTRLTLMDKAREAARLEHSRENTEIYNHVDTIGLRLEQKIDDWRKEQNGRIGALETWRIRMEAVMSVFTKGIRNRTLLLGVLVCVVFGGYLWMQTSQSLCELRDTNVQNLEAAYVQGKITKKYRDTQVEALKTIQC